VTLEHFTSEQGIDSVKLYADKKHVCSKERPGFNHKFIMGKSRDQAFNVQCFINFSAADHEIHHVLKINNVSFEAKHRNFMEKISSEQEKISLRKAPKKSAVSDLLKNVAAAASSGESKDSSSSDSPLKLISAKATRQGVGALSNAEAAAAAAALFEAKSSSNNNNNDSDNNDDDDDDDDFAVQDDDIVTQNAEHTADVKDYMQKNWGKQQGTVKTKKGYNKSQVTWNFTISGKQHELLLEHGHYGGKRKIVLDDEVILEKKLGLFSKNTSSQHCFVVGTTPCVIQIREIKNKAMKKIQPFAYAFVLDGVPFKSIKQLTNRRASIHM
jgi:hypothetical protein